MGLRINTNPSSLIAQRQLSKSSNEISKSMQRLSSGERIVNAGDDAAGLSMSQNLQAQLKGLQQAHRNANDGISLVQTAEGGMNEISNILVRMRELSVQSASDTIGDVERGYLDREVQSLKVEIDRISNVTNFNGTPLLNGNSGKGQLTFQVGTFADESNRIVFDANGSDTQASSIGVGGLSVSDQDSSLGAIGEVDQSINMLNTMRANLGATQNRLQSTVNNLGINIENLAMARSRIADTDVAAESANLIKNNILQSAGVSVLAQANNAPASALKLLG